VIEITDTEYLKIAQENGYKVWPCFQVLPDRSIFDSIKEYAAKVHEMLTDEAATDAIISRLVNYSRQYGFKGINMDFEAMGKMNREAYTAFMKKLSQEFHKNGIAISVDVTEPIPDSMYSECYDILELSKQVDYMMFMAYDEHYSGGESGSVGSHDWVEGGIKKFLSAGVPSDKLILGVPFYMRDFAVIEVGPAVDAVVVTKMETGSVQPKLYDQPSKDSAAIKSCIYGDTFVCLSMQDHWCQVGYEGKNAYIEKSVVRQVKANEKKKFTVGSFEATSKRIEKILNDQEAEVSICYDPAARQDVLTYYKFERDNSVKLKHEIWLENEKSMQWRIQLAEKYDLKGLAAWQLSYATDEMLSVFKKYKK
jgi:spore germination protein YaaH